MYTYKRTKEHQNKIKQALLGKPKTHGFSVKTDMVKFKFYRTYFNLRARSYTGKCPEAYRYLGRGITMSDEWQDFYRFIKDMYSSYLRHVKAHGIKNTTIDRKNNNLGYSKENCRWVTLDKQSENRRMNKSPWHYKTIEINGTEKKIHELAKTHGINRWTLLGRINSGWGITRALLTPVRKINASKA